MRSWIAITVVLVSVLSAAAQVQTAEDGALAATANVSLHSAYVRRGQQINDEPVFQPGMTVTKGGFSVDLVHNINLSARDEFDDNLESTETDIKLAYGHSFEHLDLSGGLIQYQFSSRKYGPTTREVFLSAELPYIPTPKAAVYYDFDAAEGFYATVGVDHNMDVFETVNLDFSFSLGYGGSGYNTLYYGVDKNAFDDSTFKVSATIELNDSLSLVPYVQYSWFWDSEIKDEAKAAYKDSEVLAVGATLSCAF